MIKYEIKKMQTSWMGDHGFKYQTVSKSDLNKHLNEEWSLHRKKYFIITHLLDWWLSLNTDQKIKIIGIIIGIILSILGWLVFK